jgi:hypothetical protein
MQIPYHMRLESHEQLRVRRRAFDEFVHQSQHVCAHAHHAVVDGRRTTRTLMLRLRQIVVVSTLIRSITRLERIFSIQCR